jgi:hypothetical protein
VTARPLAPVIPSSGVSAARQRARPAAGRPMPLACPEPVPSAPEDVVYGIGRIDASGRIADRAITSDRPAPRLPSTAQRRSSHFRAKPVSRAYPASLLANRAVSIRVLVTGPGTAAVLPALVRVNGDHHVIAQGILLAAREFLARRAVQLPAEQTSLEPHPHRAAGTGRRPFASQSTPRRATAAD